jgi:hypothetical protein
VKLGNLENTIFFANNHVENNYHGIWLGIGGQNRSIGIGFGDASRCTCPTARRSKGVTNLNLDIGIWYHVSGVIRGATDMDIFLNGVNMGGGI